MTRTETRVYPTCCTSAYCGRTQSEGCPAQPVRAAFEKWVRDSGARVSDPVWSPTVYVATVPQQ